MKLDVRTWQAFICACLFLSVHVQAVPITEFVNINQQDNEYELDRFMNELPKSWDGIWWSKTNGVRISGGSLNARRLHIEEEIKLRAALIPERFWVRFNERKLDTIGENNRERTFELEYSPVSNMFWSLIGDPEFEKPEAGIGWAFRYGVSEDNAIRVFHSILDFSANKAFRNKSVSGDFEDFYRSFPRSWRIILNGSKANAKGKIDWTYITPWEKRHNDLTSVNTDSIITGREWKIESEGWANIGDTVLGIDLSSQRGYTNTVFDLPSASGGLARKSRYLVRPYAAVPCNSKLKLRAGISYVRHKGNLWPQSALTTASSFNSTDMIPFVTGEWVVSEKIGQPTVNIETGYFHDFQKVNGNHRIEKRLKIAAGFRLGEATGLRFITGWELDKRDFGRGAYFDGGTVQFQGVF